MLARAYLLALVLAILASARGNDVVEIVQLVREVIEFLAEITVGKAVLLGLVWTMGAVWMMLAFTTRVVGPMRMRVGMRMKMGIMVVVGIVIMMVLRF